MHRAGLRDHGWKPGCGHSTPWTSRVDHGLPPQKYPSATKQPFAAIILPVFGHSLQNESPLGAVLNPKCCSAFGITAKPTDWSGFSGELARYRNLPLPGQSWLGDSPQVAPLWEMRKASGWASRCLQLLSAPGIAEGCSGRGMESGGTRNAIGICLDCPIYKVKMWVYFQVSILNFY